MRRPLALAVLALISVAAVAGGAVAWSRTNAPLERSDLEADAAFSMRMPGADELARVGSGRLFTLEGEKPPFAGHIYGTSATSADVYQFYERELARLGWQPQTPPYPSSTVELENRLSCKRKLEFRLAIEDKDRAFRAAFYHGKAYTTVFDARLRAIDPTIGCPMQPFTPGSSR